MKLTLNDRKWRSPDAVICLFQNLFIPQFPVDRPGMLFSIDRCNLNSKKKIQRVVKVVKIFWWQSREAPLPLLCYKLLEIYSARGPLLTIICRETCVCPPPCALLPCENISALGRLGMTVRAYGASSIIVAQVTRTPVFSSHGRRSTHPHGWAARPPTSGERGADCGNFSSDALFFFTTSPPLLSWLKVKKKKSKIWCTTFKGRKSIISLNWLFITRLCTGRHVTIKRNVLFELFQKFKFRLKFVVDFFW